MKKWRALSVGLVSSGALIGSAQANELQFSVNCPDWEPEAAAQVEARIRTGLLVEGLAVERVHVACEGEAASVLIEGESGTLLRAVVRRSAAIEDDVVATAEATLRELKAARASQAAVPQPRGDEQAAVSEHAAAERASVQPAAAAPLRPSQRSVASPPVVPSERSPRFTEVQAAWLGELWESHAAMGAKLGLSTGTSSYAYGIAIGGRAALGEAAGFGASEWSAALQLALSFPKAAGIVATAGAGLSLFAVSPAPNVESASSNLLTAATAELSLSRPWRFGSLFVAPSLGLRVFSAARKVRLNDQQRLVIPVLVPQVALTFGYR